MRIQGAVLEGERTAEGGQAWLLAQAVLSAVVQVDKDCV